MLRIRNNNTGTTYTVSNRLIAAGFIVFILLQIAVCGCQATGANIQPDNVDGDIAAIKAEIEALTLDADQGDDGQAGAFNFRSAAPWGLLPFCAYTLWLSHQRFKIRSKQNGKL